MHKNTIQIQKSKNQANIAVNNFSECEKDKRMCIDAKKSKNIYVNCISMIFSFMKIMNNYLRNLTANTLEQYLIRVGLILIITIRR